MARRYAIGVLGGGLGVVLWHLEPQRVAPSPISLFLVIVMFVSWYAGFGPGAVATVIGLLVTDYAYVYPTGQFHTPGLLPAIQLALFLAVAGGISWLNSDRMRLLARERTLRQSAERQAAERAALFDQMTDAVIVTNPEGYITLINEAALRMLGIDDRAGLPYSSVLSHLNLQAVNWGEEPVPDLIAHVLQGGSDVESEYAFERFDGSYVVLRGRASAIRASDNQLIGAVATFADVTAERALQQQKRDFLAGLAHDLKNPLTAIKGLAQVLLRLADNGGGLDDEAVVDRLRKIDDKADEVVDLVNHFLAASQAESLAARPETSTCDLIVLLAQVVAPIQASTDLHVLTLQGTGETVVGTWDAARLRRVLENLLSNAVKYSPDGGEIAIEVGRDADWAYVSVADPGVGIAAEDLERVFERFERGSNVPDDAAGTGLGLATARDVARDLGGEMTVESELGRGSTFTLRLPLRGRSANAGSAAG